ncbi:MAG: PIN domain-containing protein [Coriobacteriia bacterium]|nr:PIN domain-containing protein [Coriobacteriia bacterium]
MRLLLDTNIALDFMLAREPYYPDARKLMLLGYLKEAEIWISGAQINDLFYVLTKGGKPAYNEVARQSLKKLRHCVHVYRVGEPEIDAALDSSWADLEDACLYQAGLSLKADFIITRNQQDFALSSIRTLDATGFFSYLEQHEGLVFEELDLH